MANTKKAPPYGDEKRLKNVLFVVLILIFIINITASASPSDTADISSVEVHASATGDETNVISSSYISDNEATGLAISKSTASNGNIATATASAYSYFLGGSSAEATSIATSISRAGQTVYAEVKVFVSSSKYGGVAISESFSGLGTGDDISSGGGFNNNGVHGDGDGKNIDPINNDNTNTGTGNTDSIKPKDTNSVGSTNPINPVIIPKKQQYSGMFGFNFGRSDPERYYCFKMAYENKTGPCINVNNTYYSIVRAGYNMQNILEDYGMNVTDFEAKYPKENYPLPFEMQNRGS